MNIRTPILALIFISSFVLLVAHKIAIVTNLYWTTSWADVITHTLGGMLVSAIIAYTVSFSEKKHIHLFSLIFLTFLVGVLWEVFELVFQLTSLTDQGYILDTFGDLFCDVLGGFITYYLLDRYVYERK